MSRQDKLERAFLFEGVTIGEKNIFPLSANRRSFLRIMGNQLFGGDGSRAMSEEECIGEALFACSKTPAQLGSYLNNREQWNLELETFSVSCDDYAVEKFQTLLLQEIEALEAGQIEPVGKDQAQERVQL